MRGSQMKHAPSTETRGKRDWGEESRSAPTGDKQAASRDARSRSRAEPCLDLFSSIKLVIRYGGKAKWAMVLSALMATCATGLQLVPVWIIWRLVTAVLDGQADAAFFQFYALAALGVVSAGALLMGLALAMSHLAAFHLIHALRSALARHLARLPMGWFQGRRFGGGKALIMDEPDRMEMLIGHGVPEAVSAVGTWLGVTVWLFVVDWRLALAAISLTPMACAMMGVATRGASKMAGDYQAASERLNSAVVEYLAGMQVVKTFNRMGDSLDASAAAVRDFAAIETKMGQQFLPCGSLFYTLVGANVIVILPVGMVLMHHGSLSLSTLTLFVLLGANYSRPLLKLFSLFQNMSHISMASGLMTEVLDVSPQPDSGRAVDLPSHELVFERVCFGYDSHDVVHDISFTAREGAITALVGPSGSGKSTVASLIPRLFDVRAGRITLGGVDIRDIGLDQLMQQIAFVFQDSVMFADSIAANIRLGNAEASHAQICAAGRAAQAHDFIMTLPDGYDTQIGEGGVSLSGGERQRIAIARAILKDAPIILLDEATAFADPDSEAAVQDALRALAKDRTLIVVAHRLHTIMAADQIVVLNEGRIAETGQHADLAAAGGLYAALWQDYTAAQAIALRPSQRCTAQDITA